jgi:hypothetical protein
MKQPRRIPTRRKVSNFLSAAAGHIMEGCPAVTDKQVEERFEVCKSNICGQFIKKSEDEGTCGHTTCGCNMQRVGSESILKPNKLRWADQQCPIGLWPRIFADANIVDSHNENSEK